MEVHMAVTYDSLMLRCDELEASLPAMAEQYPDMGERMMAFAGIADEILHDAYTCDDGHDHCIAQIAAQGRVDDMLLKAGWRDRDGNLIDP